MTQARTRTNQDGSLMEPEHRHTIVGHPTRWHAARTVHVHDLESHIRADVYAASQVQRGRNWFSYFNNSDYIAALDVAARDLATHIAEFGAANRTRRAQTPTGRRNTFGVEIEFVGITISAMANAVERAGIACSAQGYNHRRITSWKVVPDGSVNGFGGAGELVSPPLPLTEAGLEEVKLVLKAARDAGATVNNSCGIHVHHDARGLTREVARNIVTTYANAQEDINAILPLARRNTGRGRNNGWAARVDGLNSRYLSDDNGFASITRSNRGGLRYHAVNLCAFGQHGTVEFRQHSGSLNFTKIANWIKFTGQIMDHSFAGRVETFAHIVNTVDSSYFAGRRAALAA